MSEQVNVGVVGLGRMGGALARRVLAKFPLKAYDRDSSAAHTILGPGPHVATTLDELGNCSHVVLCLPSSEASAAVVQSLSTTLRPASVIIETSTVLPADIGRMAAK